MRSLIASFFLFVSLCLTTTTEAQSNLSDVLFFATQEEGRELLGMEDDYTDKWSVFDIASRLQNKKGSKKELMEFAKDQVRPWSEAEIEKISGLIKAIDKSMADKGIVLPLPERIPLIKSTLKEEGGAVGYTRLNYIVLRQDIPFMEDDFLVKLILHEVFHVLTRKDAAFRAKMYSLIGFTVDNPVAYPKSIADRRITNPDAHASDSYIGLTVDSTDIDVVMVLYASKPYEGGVFFQYITIGFLAIEGESGSKVAKMNDGEAVIYSIDEVEGFMEQVGMNTQYIIDPEEILADNFAFAIMNRTGMPTQDIISKIQSFITLH